MTVICGWMLMIAMGLAVALGFEEVKEGKEQ